MQNIIEQEMEGIVSVILSDYKKERTIDQLDLYNQPQKDSIIDIIEKLLRIVYSGYFRDRSYKFYNVENGFAVQIEDAMFCLNKQIDRVLRYKPEYKEAPEEEVTEEAQRIAVAFFKKIPTIREYVEGDLEAAYDGDPAAYYREEIILSYPGVYAITVNRIAHELFLLGVPLIPRIMTEHAHWQTGIDIHPGATIGKSFFIDHGTGIVIGETTIIGDNVKIYQGVTLGALSTSGGQKLQGKKRHPTIEDDVVIYSGASILGGDTVIGKGSVIGGNAFVTKSIEPGTRVSIKNQELILANREKHIVTKTELEQDDTWS
ncbi:putative serine O-acetyltransferase [Clostridium sp. CAG:411]|jgi:serine O-acetyltransferase|nr:serine O-acetyltransferase EpsC [Lachnospiraceae bacterium]CDE46769.1 putative serine O-acetyltransferase [Clostridium sp. CAG:411]